MYSEDDDGQQCFRCVEVNGRRVSHGSFNNSFFPNNPLVFIECQNLHSVNQGARGCLVMLDRKKKPSEIESESKKRLKVVEGNITGAIFDLAWVSLMDHERQSIHLYILNHPPMRWIADTFHRNPIVFFQLFCSPMII